MATGWSLMTAGGAQGAARLRAVRVRATMVAVLAAGLALLVGGIALVLGLQAELSNDVWDAARKRAREVAAVIEAGRGPAPTVAGPDEEFLQIIDRADGSVVAASANVEGRPALTAPRPGGRAEVGTPLDEDPFLVVAVGAHDGDRSLVVLDGRSPPVSPRPPSPSPGCCSSACPRCSSSPRLRPGPPVGRGLRRVARAEAAQRRFVSDASHELRSPVVTVRQRAEVALTHPERADAPHARLDGAR